MARTAAQPQQGGSTGQPGQQSGQQQQGQQPAGPTQQAGQPVFRDWAAI